jgi:hypothetical protein
LAESGTWILVFAATINLFILACFVLKPLVDYGFEWLEFYQVVNFVAALGVVGSQYLYPANDELRFYRSGYARFGEACSDGKDEG